MKEPQILILLITIKYSAYASKFIANSEPVYYEFQNHSNKWASSLAGLKYLAGQEIQLHAAIKEYEEELRSKLDRVVSWIDDFEQSSVKGTHNFDDQPSAIEEISSHPLMAMRMIERFAHVQDLINDTAQQLVAQHLTELQSTNSLPSIADVKNLMRNIIRLRFVYQLPLHDLMNGRLAKTQTKVGLTQTQAYEIGLYAEKDGEISEAYRWLQSLVRLRHNNSINRTLFSELESDFKRITREINELIANQTDNNDSDSPHQPSAENENADVDAAIPDPEDPLDEIQFNDLCYGSVLQTERVRSQLFCFYETKSHPAWTINPLKIEVHSWDPYLIQLYQVITETEIQHLITESEPTMQAHAVLNLYTNVTDPNSVVDLYDRTRVASHTFINSDTTISRGLEAKIGQMTGLKVGAGGQNADGEAMRFSERIQVASYATGGYFDYHVDNLPDSYFTPLQGNSIATFMIYLNDVRLGGHTAFPRIGVAVQPVKASAIFWYSLLKNGNGDKRSVHGGCPVILGEKWVSNTWIYSFPSFQERKCSLSPDE